jgi:hypothetical protein
VEEPRPRAGELREKVSNGSRIARNLSTTGGPMAGVIKIRGSLKTETRHGNAIANYFDRGPLIPGKAAECDSWRAKHPNADHRRGVASASYNCHGLTFASRRTGIDDSQVVRAILQEDDYMRVDRKDLMVGDTVIYVDSDGDITHSGVVVDVPTFGAKS